MIAKRNEAVVYTRVSTEGQVADGVSLDAQRAKAGAWAELNGYTLAEFFTDEGVSGCRADNRPGLQAALDYACRHRAALLVYSLSRLARNTRETLEISERLEEAGADLVSLSERIDTTTAAGKMVFRMLAVLAEFERDQVSDRTCMALAHKRVVGEKTGGDVPFGYTVHIEDRGGREVKVLDRNREQQKVIHVALGLRESGATYRSIAQSLNLRGHTTANGCDWNAAGIRRAMLREAQP